MKYSDKYFFADFTTANYHKLLQLAKQSYTFRSFTNFNFNEKFVIWRHDIDFSIHRALKLAQVEAQEGVQATYFLLPHSEYYNLFEREITDIVLKIKDLGHTIGLHFDAHYYGINNEENLDKYLRFEKNILDNLFGLEIDVFSFHNTTPFTMACQQEKYAGMLNVYASIFQKQISYCSDSNGYWRFERLENVLKEAKPTYLQVLTHPEMWQDDIMSPRQRILRCVKQRAEKNILFYDQTLQKYGRENIDE